MKYIDLTQTFTADMPVFPGDPKASVTQTVFLEKDGNNDHEIKTAMHVGTHLDAPFHMLADGKRLDEMSPDHFFGPGILIDTRGKSKIDATVLKNISLPRGAIVLIYTGFGEKFHSNEYFAEYPEMTEDFAQELITRDIKMLGMDTASPDHTPPWAVHKRLLAKEILIIENLTNLEALLEVEKFEVIALPMKLQADGAPVRVIAKIL